MISQQALSQEHPAGRGRRAAMTLSAGCAICVAIGALMALPAVPRQRSASSGSGSVALGLRVLYLTPRSRRATPTGRYPRQRLIDTLAVLRGPQTKADRDPKLLRRLRSLVPTLQDPGPERLDASLVRIAGMTPWGLRIVLAGFITVAHRRASGVPEMLGALVGGQIGPREPAAAIRQRGEVAHLQIEPRSIRLVIVVPDGVARLAYSAPGIRTITVGVHNNVAAFVIRPLPAAPGLVEPEASMVWFGSRGSIIRQVPSMLGVKHVPLPTWHS